MKIPFDIKFRPQIESGEYKVVIEYDNRTFYARIVCFDFNSTELLACVNYGDREDVLEYDSSGKHIGKSVGRPDLIIITPEPGLSEFEDRLRIICENAVKEANLSPWRTSEDFAKNHAAELLNIARKELCEQVVDHTKEAYEKGKAKAKMKVLIALEALNIILFAVSLGIAIVDKNPTAACGWSCAILWCGLNFIKTIKNEKTR